MNKYPCLKQVVTVRLETLHGYIVYGNNNISNGMIDECPRKDMKTGEGYYLCKNICGQGSHAEVDAINKAKSLGLELTGARMFLKGHTYFCDSCKELMDENDIIGIIEK